ncbi:TPA: hypothetical protein U0K44_001337 [Streptococcus suis]|nr:hypothetical protein [Streptococcus suis]
MKMWKRSIILSFSLLTLVVLHACSSKVSKVETPVETEQSTTQVSSEKMTDEVETIAVSDTYLSVDTRAFSDFKLSDLVKGSVGTYSGVVSRNLSTTEYQVKINEDGTYLMLSRELLLRDETYSFPKADPRPYLDSQNVLQHKQLETIIDDKLYEFSDFYLERGVVIEKYGQLYFSQLTSHGIFPYIDQEGNIDLAKGLLVDSSVTGLNDRVIDTVSDYDTFLKLNFDYSTILSEPLETLVIDSGKLMIDGVEVPKSEKVDSFLTRGLDESLAQEKVIKQIESANDVLQFVRSKVPVDTYEITALTDFSEVYTHDSKEVKAAYAVTLFEDDGYVTTTDEREVYVYYDGTIYYGKEVNGKYVLDGAI